MICMMRYVRWKRERKIAIENIELRIPWNSIGCQEMLILLNQQLGFQWLVLISLRFPIEVGKGV